MCVVNNGTAYAFGKNVNGQLGNDNTAPVQSKPSPIADVKQVSNCFAAHDQSFVVSKDKELYAFGWNNREQIGLTNSMPNRYKPALIAQNVVMVAPAFDFALAICKE